MSSAIPMYATRFHPRTAFTGLSHGLISAPAATAITKELNLILDVLPGRFLIIATRNLAWSGIRWIMTLLRWTVLHAILPMPGSAPRIRNVLPVTRSTIGSLCFSTFEISAGTAQLATMGWIAWLNSTTPRRDSLWMASILGCNACSAMAQANGWSAAFRR